MGRELFLELRKPYAAERPWTSLTPWAAETYRAAAEAIYCQGWKDCADVHGIKPNQDYWAEAVEELHRG